MDSFDQKALIFLTMLTNAYRDEEEREQPCPLDLPDDGDFTEDFTAILGAFFLFYQHIFPDAAKEMDLIRFTHFLNSLAIQCCYQEEAKEQEAEETE